jgi:CHASE3 domain sensor protein
VFLRPLNTRNQEDKQTEIDKLKEKLKEKTAEAEQITSLKNDLKVAKTQRDESQDKELEDAIKKISNSNKDGSDTLKTYKKNSTFLMWFGIILFLGVLCQQMPRQNWGKIKPNGRRIGC